MPRFGAHMPTSGGLYKAVNGGAKIGCEAIQLFTASPRQWNSPPLKPEAIHAFRRAVEATGIGPLIAHDSYLINLATQDPALLQKSRNAFLQEMHRAEALGLDYLVTHMGAHTGAGEEAGLSKLCESLDWLHEQIPTYRVKVALETTAGQGTCLGGVFEHFPQIFGNVREPERLVVCMDTCHIFVAGYDLRTPEAVTATLDDFDRLVGLDKLCCLHANDALKGLGSHTDRHAHIGEGCIGALGFATLLADPRLPADLPVIVETPDSETHHRVNVWRLRNMTVATAPAA
ncbi:MAG: deoxyribonuclease IV [Armatimonadota bacterium]